ncbi:hypothetical protein RCL1_006952 [Eukaryota sp. TZLM3-RCL]
MFVSLLLCLVLFSSFAQCYVANYVTLNNSPYKMVLAYYDLNDNARFNPPPVKNIFPHANSSFSAELLTAREGFYLDTMYFLNLSRSISLEKSWLKLKSEYFGTTFASAEVELKQENSFPLSFFISSPFISRSFSYGIGDVVPLKAPQLNQVLSFIVVLDSAKHRYKLFRVMVQGVDHNIFPKFLDGRSTVGFNLIGSSMEFELEFGDESDYNVIVVCTGSYASGVFTVRMQGSRQEASSVSMKLVKEKTSFTATYGFPHL